MNKKSNTLFFILGATIFNIIITVLLFIILILLFTRFIIPVLPEQYHVWGFPVIFIAAIIVSFFAYRFVLNQLMKRFPLEKYFSPLFSNKKIHP